MKKRSLILSTLVVALSATPAFAKVSPEEAAKLGAELTIMGAEKAGNADGSIPAYEGGITQAPAGYEVGMHHLDPFADDKVEFVIDASNAAQYKDNLTPGQLALFELYPNTFKMKVYPTRRSASYPQYVLDATKANATTAELVDGGNGLKNAKIGVPFPIPQNGLEAIWNHTLRFRGVSMKNRRGQAAPTAGGSYTLIKLDEDISFRYTRPDITTEQLEKENILFFFKQVVKSPARLAGTALLVHETMDQLKQPRQAWTYNTGQRRVRRAPNVAFDTPGTVSDGLRTTDDFDMFNGSPVRYNWELKGKQELYIPYNDYKLHSDKVTYEEILTPGHINSDLVRYEKHRVWVVEATLKDDMRHIYKKRVFYIDEDSWQIAVTDIYDNRDQLYRVAQAHIVNYYDVPTLWTTLEVFHDLSSRRYLAMGLDNEDEMYDFNAELPDSGYTPQALRRSGRR
ncbi:DUF1329 domain-containing protein [Paraferrimonas sedimenticola]|uniref:Outer membrane lipoprotein-sorting protein n=1 Tax=Paraferrimonas sedimenticola TaxID=375674 RepID=A0AA37W2N5_9GAMM|nr:DUF1329 domain-containing protein [Paraferrimonas sedimenticola]GLP98067.1 hypothetical protein GCM10007895_33740 [Paraferrimonas sedimenticola]